MNTQAPFQQSDLADLDDRLLDRALSVVPMADVHAGTRHPQVIGLRHDMDNEIESSVAFAAWEAERGYRSTFYVLHSAPYWQNKRLLVESLEVIAGYGHEIGLHNDCLAASLETGVDARQIMLDTLAELRGYGFDVRGTVAHGNGLCYGTDGKVRFVNDELFVECARPALGGPVRTVAGLTIRPVSLADFGLDYDANWLPRGNYLSDSGGQWSQPFDVVAAGFPYEGQLHVLVHPCWWTQAFVPQEIAA